MYYQLQLSLPPLLYVGGETDGNGTGSGGVPRRCSADGGGWCPCTNGITNQTFPAGQSGKISGLAMTNRTTPQLQVLLADRRKKKKLETDTVRKD